VIAVLVAVAAGAGAAFAAAARLRNVDRALGCDPQRVADSLGRMPSRERIARAAEDLRMAGAEAEAQLLADLLGAPGERARIALTNEHLADLDARLRWGEAIPGAAARLAMLGAVLALAVHVVAAGALGAETLLVVAAGGAGWVASSLLGRAASRRADSLRRGLDALVERAMAGLGSAAPGDAPAGVDRPGPGV
jgi:Flp pilus assembly protein TadB